MATIPQIQKGFTRFVDLHLAGAFDGWQKALVIGKTFKIGIPAVPPGSPSSLAFCESSNI